MAKTTQKEVFSIVQSINRACVTGQGLDHLKSHIHEQMVTVLPGFVTRALGEKANLKAYEDFSTTMDVKGMTETEEHIDIFGSTAVAYYKYGCQWDYQGSCFDEEGHELLVLIETEGHWQIAWRTLIPGKRLVDGALVEPASDCNSMDMRQRALQLIESSPACHLTTIDGDGFPHTTAMNNLRYKHQYPTLAGLFADEDNDFALYLSTSMNSNKMARMKGNAKVSAYFCDPPQFHGLMLGGKIEIITDQDLKASIWQEGWSIYYPNGPEGPEYGVIKLVPTIAKGWSSTGAFTLDVKAQP